jgi:hypothetical protein
MDFQFDKFIYFLKIDKASKIEKKYYRFIYYFIYYILQFDIDFEIEFK